MIGMLDTYIKRSQRERQPRNVPFIVNERMPGATFVVTEVLRAGIAFLSD